MFRSTLLAVLGLMLLAGGVSAQQYYGQWTGDGDVALYYDSLGNMGMSQRIGNQTFFFLNDGQLYGSSINWGHGHSQFMLNNGYYGQTQRYNRYYGPMHRYNRRQR